VDGFSPQSSSHTLHTGGELSRLTQDMGEGIGLEPMTVVEVADLRPFSTDTVPTPAWPRATGPYLSSALIFIWEYPPLFIS
jgi:hypothetical protein